MAEISLLAWSKKFNVTYSQAQKMVVRGQIITRKVGGKVLIDEFHQPPLEQKIQCVICGASFSQITGKHLKQHDHSMQSYKAAFPYAPVVTDEVAKAISEAITGIERAPDFAENVSRGRKGIIPKNHPRHVRGTYSHSLGTRATMSVSHTGKFHTEDSKRRIGDGNRGKIMPREAVERQRLLLIEYYKTHDAPAKGKKHSEARKAEISAQRTQYWASLTPEQRAELGEKQGAPNRGKKRTNEQKARYALARTKYMSENPDTFGGPTAGELEIEAWLQKNRINYVRQFYIIGFPHPYDFFLPDHQTIVEFDGNHHWRDPWFAPRETTLVERWRMILKSMEKDAIESYFAGLNGYRIIRVRGINRCGDSPEYGSLEHQLELQGFKMPPA